MSEIKQYLTKEKMQEFKKELDYLRTTKRKEIAENLEYSKKLGDLSENAEYHEARQEQAEVEDRIGHLEQILKSAIIVSSDNNTDKAGIGSTVKVKKDGEGDVRVYKIVGSEEADMASGKVSNLSPFGSALLGKKKGDAFDFNSPKGRISYTLLDIE